MRETRYLREEMHFTNEDTALLSPLRRLGKRQRSLELLYLKSSRTIPRHSSTNPDGSLDYSPAVIFTVPTHLRID